MVAGLYDYDKLKLVNGYYSRKIYKDNEVKKCLIFNYFKGYDNDEYRACLGNWLFLILMMVNKTCIF